MDGAPSVFQIGDNFQIARGFFIVLAVAYPPNTTFGVGIYYRPSSTCVRRSIVHRR